MKGVVTIRKRISEYYEKEEKEKPKKRIELPIEEIVKKWKQGVTQKELSKEYGVSEALIGRRISEYYEKEEKGKPKKRIELPIEEIVKKWEQGVTQKELSKEYGVSRVTINKRISEHYPKKSFFYAPMVVKDFGKVQTDNYTVDEKKVNLLFFGNVVANKRLDWLCVKTHRRNCR